MLKYFAYKAEQSRLECLKYEEISDTRKLEIQKESRCVEEYKLQQLQEVRKTEEFKFHAQREGVSIEERRLQILKESVEVQTKLLEIQDRVAKSEHVRKRTAPDTIDDAYIAEHLGGSWNNMQSLSAIIWERRPSNVNDDARAVFAIQVMMRHNHPLFPKYRNRSATRSCYRESRRAFDPTPRFHGLSRYTVRSR